MPHYYYTFTHRRSSIGMLDTLTEIHSWRIANLTYDLDDPSQLLAFIRECEATHSQFFLTWWKRLTPPATPAKSA